MLDAAPAVRLVATPIPPGPDRGWMATGLPRWTALLLAATLAAGCSAPGMKLDARASGNANPGGAASGSITQRADLYAITPEVVARLTADAQVSRERAKAAALLPVAPANGSRYLIGPQDVLRVTVWNHPEITNPSGTDNELSGRVVNADGTFFFPYVGHVQAAGRTVQQVRDSLAQGLGGILKNPQVDVSVLQYRSQRVFVAGEVRTPGAVPITDVPVGIVDAIAAAGGLGAEADLSAVTVTRGSTSFTVDLYDLYYGGDISRNTRLQHGDIVHVPERRFNKVFLLGEVFRPGSLAMPRGRLTLAEALSDVGGVNPLTANSGQIFVLRGRADARPQIFHLNASSADALVLADRFELRSRDVVFVDPVKVVRWARVVNNILPTIDVLRETLNDTTTGLPR
jgi:polysaccharide biosynthesis/export protein